MNKGSLPSPAFFAQIRATKEQMERIAALEPLLDELYTALRKAATLPRHITPMESAFFANQIAWITGAPEVYIDKKPPELVVVQTGVKPSIEGICQHEDKRVVQSYADKTSMIQCARCGQVFKKDNV